MVSEVLAMGFDKWMVVDVLTYSLLRPGQVYPDSCDVRSGTGNNVGSVVPARQSRHGEVGGEL